MMLFKSILQLRFFLITLLSFFLVFLQAGFALSAEVTLAWDANIEDDLAGYKIYYFTEASNGLVDGIGLPQGASPVAISLGALQTADSPSFRLSGLTAGESYHFTVTAYNKAGNESDFSNPVRQNVPMPVAHPFPVMGNGNITPDESIEDEFPMEVGEVNVNNNWQRVAFRRTFADPVVVASAMSNNDDEPAVVRIDNITSTGFEISVQEWDYLDDDHLDETIGYVVMEAGRYALPDGTAVEASSFTADGTSIFIPVVFTGKFNHVPVIVSSVASYNGQNAAAIRLQNITEAGFEARIQEQQANRKSHPSETVSYIAWEPCRTRLNGLSIEVARTDDIMTHDFKTIRFNKFFPVQPVFIASIQTTGGSDTAALRWEERNVSSIQVKVEEEQSFDPETHHTSEVVGFFSFSPDTTAGAD